MRTKVQYEERLRQVERGAAQLLSGIRNHEQAVRRELGLFTAEERQMADIHMNGFLITARTQELSPTESRDVDAGRDVTLALALDRLEGNWRSLEEARQAEQEEKRARERIIVIEKTHNHVRDEGDVWEL